MKIGFIGLGKLGLPCAMAVGSKGHEVCGYDIDSNVKNILKTRKLPYREEGAQELLDKTNLKFKDSIMDVVKESEIIFVPIQTPHDPLYEGITRIPDTRVDFNYEYLKDGIKELSRCVDELKQEKIVIIISTVLPGTVETHLKPVLSDKIKLCYNPFFIAMGTCVNDFLNSEFILFGVDDEEAARRSEEFYKTITDSPFYKTTVKNAELIKVAYNTFIGMKIVFANTLMEICHKTGASVDAITDALKMGHRRIISPSYFSGGMGDGGGCLLPDGLIFTESGIKEIQNIEIGEMVLCGDGKLHKVIETYKRPYKGKILGIKSRGLPNTWFTPEHPIHVARDNRKKYFINGKYRYNNANIDVSNEIGEKKELPVGDLNKDFYTLFPVLREDDKDNFKVQEYSSYIKKILEMQEKRYPNVIFNKDGNYYHHIQELTVKEYEGTVYNLNVDEVHNYVTTCGCVNNCHPRDNIALSWLARELNLSHDWFEDLMYAREDQTAWLADLMEEHKLPKFILGKAFKPETNLTIGSPSILLKNLLEERGYIVDSYDPWVDKGKFNPKKPYVFLIGTKHEEFVNYKFPKGSVVVDPWRYIPDQEGVHVIRVGE